MVFGLFGVESSEGVGWHLPHLCFQSAYLAMQCTYLRILLAETSHSWTERREAKLWEEKFQSLSARSWGGKSKFHPEGDGKGEEPRPAKCPRYLPLDLIWIEATFLGYFAGPGRSRSCSLLPKR